MKKKQEKLVQVAIKENEEIMQKVLSKNEERMEELKRENHKREMILTKENDEIVKRQKMVLEESLANLLSCNDAQLAELMAKKQKQEERNQPAAPECPVCCTVFNFVVSRSSFFSRFALMRWCLPPGSSTALTGTTSARPASILKETKKPSKYVVVFFSITFTSGHRSTLHFAQGAGSSSLEGRLIWKTF